MNIINNYHRYQVGLTMNHLFPKREGFCACGCGRKLMGKRRKWHSNKCQQNAYIQFSIIKGDTRIIRKELYKRDNGFCRYCGSKEDSWHADHINPVVNGGGASELENFQTLCIDCHKGKTRFQIVSHRATISSHAANILEIDLLYAFGETINDSPKISKEIHR